MTYHGYPWEGSPQGFANLQGMAKSKEAAEQYKAARDNQIDALLGEYRQPHPSLNPFFSGLMIGLGFWAATLVVGAITLGFFGALSWWRG